MYKADFDRVRRDYPDVTDVLVAFLANVVRRQNQLLVEALYLPAETRVLRRLVDLATVYEGREEIPLTQEELAELAGTSRATVNGYRPGARRGTLELRRGRIVILDVAQLRRRAR